MSPTNSPTADYYSKPSKVEQTKIIINYDSVAVVFFLIRDVEIYQLFSILSVYVAYPKCTSKL